MPRLHNLADESLVTTLLKARQDLDQLKNAQRNSGASGVIGYHTENAVAWDATGTVGSDSDTTSTTHVITITFTGDGTQAYPMVNFSYDLYVNGTDASHKLDIVDPNWTDGTRSASMGIPASGIGGTTYVLFVDLTTTKQITYYVKARADGSSPGTITVSVS